MSVKEKKHVFVFSTQRGDLTVGTDNINELANMPWFAEFLGMQHYASSNQSQSVSEVEARARELANQYANEYVTQFMQQQQGQQQSQQGGAPQQTPQQAAPQQAPPQQASQTPQDVRAAFMEVTPDKMSQEMWNSMSVQEQQQYGQRYAASK